MNADQFRALQSDKVTRKVILLSICKKLDNLTLQDLMEIALESMYMDYFQFVTLLDELLDEQLLSKALRKGEKQVDAAGRVPERFSITPKGLLVLDTLKDQIPTPVNAYLHRSLSERESALKNESSVHARTALLPEGQYELHLELYENGERYFSCRLAVPSEKIAKEAARRWKEEAAVLYPEVLKLLLCPEASETPKTEEDAEEKAEDTEERSDKR